MYIIMYEMRKKNKRTQLCGTPLKCACHVTRLFYFAGVFFYSPDNVYPCK